MSGPIARGSGVDFDLRRDEPYLAYGRAAGHPEGGHPDRGRLPGPLRGACWSRRTTRSTSRTPAWTGSPTLPPGPINQRLPKVLKAPEGHTYAWTENPLGINGYYLVCKGEKTPYRLKLRSASYNNIQALDRAAAGHPGRGHGGDPGVDVLRGRRHRQVGPGRAAGDPRTASDDHRWVVMAGQSAAGQPAARKSMAVSRRPRPGRVRCRAGPRFPPAGAASRSRPRPPRAVSSAASPALASARTYAEGSVEASASGGRVPVTPRAWQCGALAEQTRAGRGGRPCRGGLRLACAHASRATWAVMSHEPSGTGAVLAALPEAGERPERGRSPRSARSPRPPRAPRSDAGHRGRPRRVPGEADLRPQPFLARQRPPPRRATRAVSAGDRLAEPLRPVVPDQHVGAARPAESDLRDVHGDVVQPLVGEQQPGRTPAGGSVSHSIALSEARRARSARLDGVRARAGSPSAAARPAPP